VTDEEVGAWAANLAAFVTTDAAGTVSQTIEPAGLPAGKYSVVSLGFPSLAKVGEEDLARVGQLKRLGFLEFKDAAGLTAAGVAALSQGAPISTLIMRNVPLADADLTCLGRIRTLRTIDIHGAPRLTGTVLREWKSLGLTRLSIGGWSYTEGALAGLADLKSLQSLTLGKLDGLTVDEFAQGLRFSPNDVELAHLPALRGQLRAALRTFPRAASVRLTGLTLDPADLDALAGFKPMTFLQLAETGTGDAQVAAIARSTTLTTLHWFGFATVGTSLDALAACRPLRQLALSNSRVTDDGLRAVATLPQVERLLLDGNSAITDDGIGALAAMKQLRTLRLSGTPVTGAALSQLTALRRLESLELVGCPGVAADDVAAFRKALPRCQVAHP
jgi:hypothetical protein